MKNLFFYPTVEVGQRRRTVAGIVEEGQLKVGVAQCSSKDQFVKSKGRAIASGRAAKKPVVVLSLKEGASPVQEFIAIAKTL